MRKFEDFKYAFSLESVWRTRIAYAKKIIALDIYIIMLYVIKTLVQPFALNY